MLLTSEFPGKSYVLMHAHRYEELHQLSEAGPVDEQELAKLVVRAAQKRPQMASAIEFAKTVIAGAKRRRKSNAAA